MCGTWEFFTAMIWIKYSDMMRNKFVLTLLNDINSYKLNRNDLILSTGITGAP